MVPVCPTAHGVGLSADGNTLYVTCANSDQIAVLDVSDRGEPDGDRARDRRPDAGHARQPELFALRAPGLPRRRHRLDQRQPLGRRARVRSGDDDDGRQQDREPVGLAMFGNFAPDGKTFYVPHQGAMDSLHAIDTTTHGAARSAAAAVGVHQRARVRARARRRQRRRRVRGRPRHHPGSIVFVNVQAFAITGFVQTLLYSDGAAWLPPM